MSLDEGELLRPFVPRLTIDWLRSEPERTHRAVDGTLAFVDISGFTQLTERLARRGKVGAEELSEILNATFSALLTVAYEDGAGLVKWGGDAVLLQFDGPNHAPRAAQAAHRMRALLRDIGRISTGAGSVRLRMSIGIHSGRSRYFLVGDPAHHRELLVCGPAASTTAVMESTADAGEILLSGPTAELLPAECVGDDKGAGRLLRRSPSVEHVGVPPLGSVEGLDLKRVLPGSIREQVLAATSDTEHRMIAVGFLQFSGTDELLESSGASVLAEALDECMCNVQAALARYEVTFFASDVGVNGGKVMMTAGAPRSVEHAEERLVLASRQILRNAGTLPLRIGVNRGNVFSGDFGPRFRRTYSVIGDAVNLAARVMGKARPGQLLATQAVMERTAAPIFAVRLDPFTVKGKKLPVLAHAVLIDEETTNTSPAPQPRDGPTVTPLPKGQLLGREGDLRTLHGLLDSARAGEGRVVQVAGEPGIGKSRLVEEFTAASRDARLVTANCEEYEASTPYFALRHLLRQAMGWPDDLGGEDGSRELTRCVGDQAPDLVPWVPLLAAVLDLPAEPTASVQALDAQHRKWRMGQAVVDLLGALLTGPTLIVVDDAHLMDDASAEMFARLAVEVPQRHWLLLVTRREMDAGFVPGDGVVTLRPTPLDDEASRTLAEQLTEELPLAPHLVEALLRRAGGNPLFLRGLAHAALSQNDLDSLPDSVDGLVNSQIDKLAPRDRSTLRAAAVLGLSFTRDDLAKLLDDGAVVTETLERLDGFVSSDERGRLSFRHALLRDAAYQGLAYRRRRDLHGRAGELLEARSDSPELNSELLSFHYFHSQRYDRAWHFSKLAGERARAKLANVEAIEFFERATAVAGRNPKVTESERGEVFEALGDARFVIGLSADADASFKAARRHVREDPLRDAELLLKQARAAKVLGSFPLALRRLTRGMNRLEGVAGQPGSRAFTDRVDSTRSQLASEYALCRTMQGQYRDAISWGLRAASLAERCGDEVALARAYVVLQDVHVWSGRQQDRPFGELALRIYEARGELVSASHCLNGLAVEAMFAGRWPEALDMYQRARSGYERAGAASDAANCEYNVADLLLRQGHVTEARELLHHVRRVARGVNDPELGAFATRELGRATSRLGEADDGLALCREARAAFVQLGAHHEEVDTDIAEAEGHLLRGDLPAALSLIDQAEKQAVAIGAATLLPTVRRVRSFALLSEGRLAAAQEEFEAVLRISEPPAPQHEVAYALAGLRAVAWRRDGSVDPVTDRRARQALDSFGIVALPDGAFPPGA